MTESLLAVIARVRRAMPRNPDVMLICDEAEKLLIKVIADKAEARCGSIAKEVVRSGLGTVKMPMEEISNPGFDKKTYQRDYMRRRRAKEKR